MIDIYVLGSGGFAKEVYFLIKEINRNSLKCIYDFKGFIDITSEKELYIGGIRYPIINEDEFIATPAYNGTSLALGIGNPAINESLHKKFIGNYLFPNLISPGATGDWDSIAIDVGNIITSGCNLTVDIKIGSFNVFNLNTTIGHDTIIESYNVINPGVNISGGVKIGNTNLIGTNATILQNIIINSNSILGASSLLTKNLASNQIAVGIPAKPIKENVK